MTVEMHDLSQRYWNILADSSRATKEMGVVSIGSIHHKTGVKLALFEVVDDVLDSASGNAEFSCNPIPGVAEDV